MILPLDQDKFDKEGQNHDSMPIALQMTCHAYMLVKCVFCATSIGLDCKNEC